MSQDKDNRTVFTPEEIKAAKQVRDEIINGDISEFKSIYMAGEIVMWDEMKQTIEGLQADRDEEIELREREYNVSKRRLEIINQLESQLSALQSNQEREWVSVRQKVGDILYEGNGTASGAEEVLEYLKSNFTLSKLPKPPIS